MAPFTTSNIGARDASSLANATSSTHQLVGFTPEPDGRGTIGILISCLAVLLLNTWTVFHPNIPPESQPLVRRWAHRWYVTGCAVIAPDTIATVSFSQWRYARKATKELRPMLPWWTMKHGFYAEMGGYRVLDKSSGQMYCFRAPQLAWLHKQKVITIPEVSIKDIDDRSVADGLAKLLACAQSTWFLFSTCARLQQHLALTTLEVELLPYVVVTWMIYLFWWNKPLQLETYTTISVQALSIPTLIWLAEATLPIRTKPLWWRPVPFELHERGWEFYWMEKPWDLKKLQVIDTNHLIPLPLRNRVECTMAESWVADWYRDAVNDAHPCEWDCWDDIVIYCTGIFIFGVPLAAWHFDFPTQAEGILWRTAALASCGVITIWVPLALCLRWLTPGNTWKELPFYVLTPICGFSRLYLIIEIFAGLRLLPRGVFETVNWSSYLPHVF